MGICRWCVILGAYLRFYYGMKHQNLSRDDLCVLLFNISLSSLSIPLGLLFFFLD